MKMPLDRQLYLSYGSLFFAETWDGEGSSNG